MNFIKKDSQAQCFSCEFCKISKNPLFYRTSRVAASLTWQLQTNASEWCDNLRVASYELRVGSFLCELRVTFYELKIKITSCQSSLRVASYYSRVMSYFLQVENKNYESQVMALFHLKKKFTKHSEDRKSSLPV